MLHRDLELPQHLSADAPLKDLVRRGERSIVVLAQRLEERCIAALVRVLGGDALRDAGKRVLGEPQRGRVTARPLQRRDPRVRSDGCSEAQYLAVVRVADFDLHRAWLCRGPAQKEGG